MIRAPNQSNLSTGLRTYPAGGTMWKFTQFADQWDRETEKADQLVLKGADEDGLSLKRNRFGETVR